MDGQKKPYKKIAFALSLCAIVVWGLLGMSVSLAWFADTSDTVTNIFHTGEFKPEVTYLAKDGKWETVEGDTEIFDREALYEPGYVQVVYLQVENAGDLAFNFSTAISVLGSTTATNAFGQEFWLHHFLRFGVVYADTYDAVRAAVATRDLAEAVADQPLQHYASEAASLAVGDSTYIALVVRMPSDVGNEANYRFTDAPQVQLGIVVKAEQQ